MDNWKKQFAIIYSGQAFSLLGSSAVQFAVIWWLTVQTQSAITLTLAFLIVFIPNMLIGPFAGVWIDRYNRRTIMIAADGLVALSSVALGIAFLMVELPPVWFIYVILFLRGLGNTFHAPAMQAAIPMLVPSHMLTKAGGWGNMVNSLSNMFGPVMGAALYGILPMAAIMLVDIAGAVFAIACLLMVKIPNTLQRGEKRHLLDDMKQGLDAMRENKPLMAVFPALILMNILYMPLGSLFRLLILVHFDGTAWHTGAAEFVFAGGLLVSSLVVGIWGGMKRRFLMAALAIGVLGAAALVSGTLPKEGFWFFIFCCFLMGGSGTFIHVPIMVYTQETIAPEKMGKVFSLQMTAMTWAMPVGLLVAGPISELIGINWWFFWSGLALMATALLCRMMTRRYDPLTMLLDSN
jgi:DHA3 family macrolide efflux protein-like MFS transporter